MNRKVYLLSKTFKKCSHLFTKCFTLMLNFAFFGRIWGNQYYLLKYSSSWVCRLAWDLTDNAAWIHLSSHICLQQTSSCFYYSWPDALLTNRTSQQFNQQAKQDHLQQLAHVTALKPRDMFVFSQQHGPLLLGLRGFVRQTIFPW